jgi:phage shock protein A
MNNNPDAMTDVATLVSGIEYKIRKIIGAHQQVVKENATLGREIQELRQVINHQKESIRQLEEKVKILKLANTLESKEGNVEAKLKINELVREIDKCIGLLNT